MFDPFEEARRRDPAVCYYCGWGRVNGERRWFCVNPNCLHPARTNSDKLDPVLSDPLHWPD
jgi:hypothetical protein